LPGDATPNTARSEAPRRGNRTEVFLALGSVTLNGCATCGARRHSIQSRTAWRSTFAFAPHFIRSAIRRVAAGLLFRAVSNPDRIRAQRRRDDRGDPAHGGKRVRGDRRTCRWSGTLTDLGAGPRCRLRHATVRRRQRLRDGRGCAAIGSARSPGMRFLFCRKLPRSMNNIPESIPPKRGTNSEQPLGRCVISGRGPPRRHRERRQVTSPFEGSRP